jgi:hypothetical protein
MDVGIKTANDQFQSVTTAERTAIASPVVGQAVWDSTLRQIMVYMNATTGNAWQPLGNTIVCASTTRPLSPFEGQEIYETDSNKTLVYTGAAWVETGDLDNTGGLSDNAYWTSIRKNIIINGMFSIDQRNAGAAQTITSGAALAYTADRWYAYCTGANVTGQRLATGTAPNQYNYKFTGAASNTLVGFGTRLEQVDTFHLAGTTATLSANIASSTLTSITWSAYYATTADTFGTIASPTRTLIATGTFTISATLASYNAQISVPAAATTGIEIVFTTGALLAAATLTFAGIQLEQNTTATILEREPIQQTLAKCQRYYFRPVGTSAFSPYVLGFTQTTSIASFWVNLPVPMRVAPTSVGFSNLRVFEAGGTSSTVSGIVLNSPTNSFASIDVTTAAVLTATRATILQNNNNVAGYFELSAEL